MAPQAAIVGAPAHSHLAPSRPAGPQHATTHQVHQIGTNRAAPVWQQLHLGVSSAAAPAALRHAPLSLPFISSAPLPSLRPQQPEGGRGPHQPVAAAAAAPEASAALVRARRRQRLARPAAAAPSTAAEAPTSSRASSARLTAAQEQELSAAIVAASPGAEAAVATLVQANVPLVHHIARRFQGRGLAHEVRWGVAAECLLAPGCLVLRMPWQPAPKLQPCSLFSCPSLFLPLRRTWPARA